MQARVCYSPAPKMTIALESPAPAPLRVHVVETGADLAALGARWEALQKDAALSSVFESFDWQHLWWQTYGRGQPLKVLVATDGDAVVGILALYVQTVPMLHYPVRLLRFVGSGGDTAPDDLGPILARGREAEVAQMLADAALRVPGWDVLLLSDMNPACAFTSVIAAAARPAGLVPSNGRSERIAYLDLPPTWEAWLETQSPHRRKRIRYLRKKLATSHQARFFVWDDAATLDEGFDRLAHLHHRRWATSGEQHSFSSPEYNAFHRAVMKACLGRGRLRLYCLELSGQIVAMQYCYRFRGGVYIMQTGFDPDFSDAGQALLWYMTEHAIGEGDKVLDFLRGDHAYKDKMATGERETVFVTAHRRTPGAWVYRTRRVVLPALKGVAVRAIKRLRSVSQQISPLSRLRRGNDQPPAPPPPSD